MSGARFRVYDADLIVFTDKVNAPADKRKRAWGRGFESPDWETFNRLLKVLEAKGFTVGRDARVEKDFPTLGPLHRDGAAPTPHGELKFKAETYRTGCKIVFFQEVVFENPYGGQHDFDRRTKMPYLIRKKFEGTIAALTMHLVARGFVENDRDRHAGLGHPIGRRLAACEDRSVLADGSEDVATTALAYFNSRWDGEYERRRGIHRFERGSDGWPTARVINDYGRNLDHDKREIRHGEVRCCRGPKGHLVRGRVFGGINGRWLVVYGPGARDYTHASNYELFTYQPGVTPRKAHPSPRPLEAVLKAAVAHEDYERAAKLRDLIRARRAQAERTAA